MCRHHADFGKPSIISFVFCDWQGRLAKNPQKSHKSIFKIVILSYLERMLLETDAPYQSPVKDHRHEPADVVNIYRKVSEIKNIPLPELEAALEKNYREVFGEE